ncbi:hypothetical protein VB711_11545 [Cronbergia sp. UHCC 0137]|uniref:hypothetical protein n=1 Tax=Cronbergia sp. UHCC 0137 TaxID=3110239 RepID=UPI002B200735|nr:hypothetical protein [Cronbergia sp. UHCC 0137]MEA5618465.1 hypothetical protein [Cronbergia sp. UHCC 0137]
MAVLPTGKDNPTYFPLRIFLREYIGETKKLTILVTLPNSIWIPRVGEKLVLPRLHHFSGTPSQVLKVEDVFYRFDDAAVCIICEKQFL